MEPTVFQTAFAVAAIEFGTVTSQLAVSLESFSFLVKWDDPTLNSFSPETTTCILIKPDGLTLDSFGYEAESRYEELATNEKKNYYFFKGFSGLETFEDNDGTIITIKDEFDKRIDAIEVFAMMIKYMMDSAMKSMANTDIKLTDFGLVIVLPGGSSRVFMKLMKKAAKKAGIDDRQFIVITSTDAAALLFAHPPESKKSWTPEGYRFWERPSMGTKFLSVIAEDESVVTVVHSVENDGTVREMSALKKGGWGISMIIRKFEVLLADIVGQSVFDSYKNNMKDDWLELISNFKVKIRIGLFNSEHINLRLPSGFLEHVREMRNTNLKEAIDNSKYANDITCYSSILRLPNTIFIQLFEETLEQIKKQIKSVMSCMHVKAIFMAGKFADFPVFRDAMTTAFKDVKVTFYKDSSTALLTGAFNAAHKKGMLFEGLKLPLVVAAIDFGTTYSGWSKSNLHEYNDNPTKASFSHWHSDLGTTEKAPTHILLREDGKTVEAFGYEAIRRYRELAEEGEEKSVYYFRNFKMALHKKIGEKLDRNIMLEDEVGRSLPAIDVFAASIRFLREDLLQQCKNQLINALAEDEVQWVLTVPAIWSDGAKQFMREAAIKAGIKSRRLMLALEPEAASIYCRHLPVEAQKNEGCGSSVSTFRPGTKYMVLDAGGGTVDITVHEVIYADGVKEVYAASGGAWGGMMVNNAFEKLIEDLVGKNVYSVFCKEETEDHLELIASFEIKKRLISPTNNSLIRMTLPASLSELYASIKGSSIGKDVMSSAFSDDIKVHRDKITFSAELIRSLFKDCVENILRHVANILKDIQVTAILMVGGFSDSKLLQSAVKEKFKGIEIVVPKEAVTSILNGALIFGYMPRQITERVLKYTYGVRVMRSFIAGQHPESKRVSSDQGDKCKDLFDRHVRKNQRVKVGEPQAKNKYTPVNKSQRALNFDIYASELENPEFTDQNCTFVGKLRVDLTDHDGDLNRSVTVALTFSDTEIVVEARDEKTGEQTSVAIDFLG